MKSHWSFFLFYGLVMTTIEISNTSGVKESCKHILNDFSNPAMELLDVLSKLCRTTDTPFKIRIKTTEPGVILSGGGNCNHLHGTENVTCKYKPVLGQYGAVIAEQTWWFSPQVNQDKTQDTGIINRIKYKEISLNVTLGIGIEKSELISNLCEMIINSSSSSLTEKIPCTTTPRIPCDDVCNNDKTTLADSHMPSTTKEIRTKEDLQVSVIVISSVSSFFGGVVCTLFTLFVIRFICQRKPKQASTDDNSAIDDVRFKTKVDGKDKLKPQSSPQITYETLNSTKCAGTGEEHTDHVYLGLGSNSKCNELSGVRNVKEKALQANSIDSPEHFGCKQTKDERPDHVYNVLKSEEAANVYQSTEAKELNEHTYTKLADRGPEKRHARQESPEEVSVSDNSRLSETHNYFILEDEVNDNTGNRTRKTSEVQGIDISMNEIADEQSSFDHAYFTLHKIEDSSCSTPEKEQLNDELEEDVDDHTDGHAYHTLERI